MSVAVALLATWLLVDSGAPPDAGYRPPRLKVGGHEVPEEYDVPPALSPWSTSERRETVGMGSWYHEHHRMRFSDYLLAVRVRGFHNLSRALAFEVARNAPSMLEIYNDLYTPDSPGPWLIVVRRDACGPVRSKPYAPPEAPNTFKPWTAYKSGTRERGGVLCCSSID